MTAEAYVLTWLCRRGAATLATPAQAAAYRFRLGHRGTNPPRRGHPDRPHADPVGLVTDHGKMAADAAAQAGGKEGERD